MSLSSREICANLELLDPNVAAPKYLFWNSSGFHKEIL